MKIVNKLLFPLLVLALTGCGNVATSTGPGGYQPSLPENPSGVFTDSDFLGVKGNKIKTDYGEGKEIILKGVNAGGYLLIEQWMCAFKGGEEVSYYDHKVITDTFTQRFGKEETLNIWEYYRNNFWTDYDFQNCADMNMNVIRLPFSYMSVDPQYNNVREIPGQKYNFELLDNFVAGAAEHGIYTILDCHGAYGSQNGQDHSGESKPADQVDFYSNEENMKKTIDMWAAIAEHFKDNPAVAAYDILNEPGERNAGEGTQSTTTRHWNFFDRVYDAIREKDPDHITIFESCWDGANLPQPSKYGWTNSVYSFHNYSGESDANKNLVSMQNKISGVENQNFNIPYYMGEFNCYGNEQSWEKTLSLFASKQWHWTSWTYKLNRSNDHSYAGWGIYYSKASRVNPHSDDLETIYEKWYNIDTAHEAVSPMRFESDNTLFNIMKKYCGA